MMTLASYSSISNVDNENDASGGEREALWNLKSAGNCLSVDAK